MPGACQPQVAFFWRRGELENGDGRESVNRPLKQGAQVGPDAAPWLEIWTVVQVLRHSWPPGLSLALPGGCGLSGTDT